MYTAYSTYIIWITDPAEYAAALAITVAQGFVSGEFIHCPLTASSTFGTAWPQPAIPPAVSKWLTCAMPWGIPAYPGPGTEINFPTPSGVFIKSDVDNVIVPGDIDPIWHQQSQSMLLVWVGYVMRNFADGDPSNPPDPLLVAKIPRRRFITSFYIPSALSEGYSGVTNAGSRASARTMDGIGFPIRGDGSDILHTLTTLVPGIAEHESWERLYIRVNTLPATDQGFWYASGSGGGGGIGGLILTTAGNIKLVSALSTAGAQTTLGTSATALTLGKWYLLDFIVRFPANAGDYGELRLWINHIYEAGARYNGGNGLDTVGFHASSRIALWTGVTDAKFSMDLDDWMNADVPSIGGVESLTSVDWTMGSHMKPVKVTSAVIDAGWTGGILSDQILNQYINPEASGVATMTSATALATITALTNVSDSEAFPYFILGPVSTWIGSHSSNSGTSATARLGYKLAGGAAVMVNVTEGTSSATWFGIFQSATGNLLPVSIDPFYIIKEKSNDATRTNTVRALTATVEYIGYFGLEDDPNLEFPDISNNINLHNCHYANTMWANPFMVPVDAPCFMVGGTYVGNSLATTIDLPYPAHMILIRAVVASASLFRWFSTNLGGGHIVTGDTVPPFIVTRSYVDSTGQAKFVTIGSAATNNQAGVTYQYIAFCDPGNRFCLNGAYNIPPTADNTTIPLWVSDFLPELGIINFDAYGPGAATAQPRMKGPGNAGNTGNGATGTAYANWGSWVAGSLTLLADNLYTATDTQASYSLWRSQDPDCLDSAVQIFTYTGNGLVARKINLPLVTGRYPLFVYVQQIDGNGYYRDPSHTGNDSSPFGGAGAVTNAGITGGGADYFDVSATCNVNLKIYNVFVILGSGTAWENGEFFVSNCEAKGPFIPPTPVVPPTPGPGGLNFNGSAGILNVQNLSGIYTLITGKTDDTFYTGIGATTNTVKIPDPLFKTGYIGG